MDTESQTIQFSSSESAEVLFAAAYKGDKGDKGDTGEKGDKGDKGDTGDPGTTVYSELSDKPRIGGVTLDGNKTAAQLGLCAQRTVQTSFPSNNELVFGTVYEVSGITGSLTLTIPASGTVLDEVEIWLTTGSTAPTITFSGIVWSDGKVPTFSANKLYSILLTGKSRGFVQEMPLANE